MNPRISLRINSRSDYGSRDDVQWGTPRQATPLKIWITGRMKVKELFNVMRLYILPCARVGVRTNFFDL